MNDVSQHVLDRWAQRAAVRDIQSELATSGVTIKRIYKIIEDARALHDPRATFRKGRAKVGRIVEKKRKPGRRIKEISTTLKGWWFGAEIHTVT